MFGKKENVNANRYIVMSKLDGQTTFYTQKGFATRDDADTYAKLMMKTEEYDKNNYYLFEQSVSYSLGEKDVVRTEESFSTNGWYIFKIYSWNSTRG